jgi:hypothetical protein
MACRPFNITQEIMRTLAPPAGSEKCTTSGGAVRIICVMSCAPAVSKFRIFFTNNYPLEHSSPALSGAPFTLFLPLLASVLTRSVLRAVHVVLAAVSDCGHLSKPLCFVVGRWPPLNKLMPALLHPSTRGRTALLLSRSPVYVPALKRRSRSWASPAHPRRKA